MDLSTQGKAGSFPEKNTKTRTVAVPSEIAQNLKAAMEDDAARYDASARNLVAEKPVLAYILKSALEEYADYTVQEIAEKFIEGTPEIRMTAVHPDHPDKKSCADSGGMMSGDDKVEGISTEDKSQKDGTVYYDIRFLAVLPLSGELIEIFINIEIQNNDTPGYPIPKRGIYYAARMISSQRGTVFKDQEYGRIKKVASIWLCEDTADARSDTINRYSFTEESLRGDFHEDKKDYDLMTVVVLRLGRKGKDSGDNAIRLLSRMFSTDLKYEEKIDTLQNDFKISVTREISEEVLNVCNLSTGVFTKAYNSGYGLGFESGFDEGRQSGFDEGRQSGFESGFDEGRQSGFDEGRQSGFESGFDEGQEKFGQLNLKLIQAKRFDDLTKASKDATYREKLYKEFGL